MNSFQKIGVIAGMLNALNVAAQPLNPQPSNPQICAEKIGNFGITEVIKLTDTTRKTLESTYPGIVIHKCDGYVGPYGDSGNWQAKVICQGISEKAGAIIEERFAYDLKGPSVQGSAVYTQTPDGTWKSKITCNNSSPRPSPKPISPNPEGRDRGLLV